MAYSKGGSSYNSSAIFQSITNFLNLGSKLANWVKFIFIIKIIFNFHRKIID